MTRKDYRKIADVFLLGKRKLSREGFHPDTLDIITEEYIHRLADVLTKDNPAFDPKRFYDACKGE